MPTPSRRSVASTFDAYSAPCSYLRLPDGYQQAINLLYGEATTSVGKPTDGPTETFPISSGVPQGCPLIGSVFTTVLRTLLEMLVHECGPDVVYIYADDVAVILKTRRDCTTCHNRPTSGYFAAGVAALAPQWRGVRVAMGGEYLGYVIGPVPPLRARWAKPLQKYETRCWDSSRAQMAPSAGLSYHEIFAAATLA